jgi:hypothetical protein
VECSLLHRNLYAPQLTCEERSYLTSDETLVQEQPFLSGHKADFHSAELLRELGGWESHISPEQTAFELSQVTAASVLPPLMQLDSGSELLEYHVRLRDHLASYMVMEMMAVLDSCGEELNWNQVDTTTYVCVIGAGVAACIDTTPGQEILYLRYANTLVSKLYGARRAAEMPRSLLFLQTTLHERVDALLAQARPRCWYWLIR